MFSKMAMLVIGLLSSSIALTVVFVPPAAAFDIDGIVPNMTLNEVKGKLATKQLTKFVKTDDRPSFYEVETANPDANSHYSVMVCKQNQKINRVTKFFKPTTQNFILLSHTLNTEFGMPAKFLPGVYESSYATRTNLNIVWVGLPFGTAGISLNTHSDESPPSNLSMWMSTGGTCP